MMASDLDAHGARFLRKTLIGDGCWEWQAALDRLGYGSFGRSTLGWSGKAHRFSYQFFVGPIAPGLSIDHLCRNRRCVRPDHLEAVDHRTNVLRGAGPTAVNAAKTHCIHGHPLAGENLILRNGGARDCRACMRRRINAYGKRKRGTD